jgi:hypothetical protein
MALAGMLAQAHDELVCDLAETYHIYDMRALPVRTLAVLACGLGANSRVWATMCGYKAKWSDIVQAMIADRLAILQWFQTEDGHKGINRPQLLAPMLLGQSDQSEDKEKEYITFDSGEDFLAAWNRL